MVNISQPNKPIPPLQIGDGKEKPRVEYTKWWQVLINKFIGISINF